MATAPEFLHPVDLIEAEVSRVFSRSMKEAEAQNRFLSPVEEFNLSVMSAAVSLRRIADAFRILVIVLVLSGFVALALRLI